MQNTKPNPVFALAKIRKKLTALLAKISVQSKSVQKVFQFTSFLVKISRLNYLLEWQLNINSDKANNEQKYQQKNPYSFIIH